LPDLPRLLLVHVPHAKASVARLSLEDSPQPIRSPANQLLRLLAKLPTFMLRLDTSVAEVSSSSNVMWFDLTLERFQSASIVIQRAFRVYLQRKYTSASRLALLCSILIPIVVSQTLSQAAACCSTCSTTLSCAPDSNTGEFPVAVKLQLQLLQSHSSHMTQARSFRARMKAHQVYAKAQAAGRRAISSHSSLIDAVRSSEPRQAVKMLDTRMEAAAVTIQRYWRGHHSVFSCSLCR
jgi:hypothetical protein